MVEKIQESKRIKEFRRKKLLKLGEKILVGVIILGLISGLAYNILWKDYLAAKEMSWGEFCREFTVVIDPFSHMPMISNYAEAEKVEKVVFRGDVFIIKWKDENLEPIKVRPAVGANVSVLSQSFIWAGVTVESKWAFSQGVLWNIIAFLASMGLLAFLIFFLPKMLGTSLGGLFKKKKPKPAETPTTTFEDVAGIDEAKQELKQLVDFLKDPTGFEALGATMPKGYLLLGPPGCGKTLIARAVAGEAKVPFFNRSGSEFIEMIVGVGAQRIRDLFEEAKRLAPSIIFIDEIDAVGGARGGAGPISGGEGERQQTINQLMTEMDGFSPKLGIIVIGATNRPDLLDTGLTRAGRIDRRISIDLPDIKGREEILKVHVRNKPLAEDVNLKKIAQGTSGFSGADLADLVNKAALKAGKLRKDREKKGQAGDKILMEDFQSARDRVLMGSERRNFFLTQREKEHNAYYEAAKVIVAKSLPLADPIYKVSIVPRGLALGKTQLLPEKDNYVVTREHILTRIKIGLAGRAIERLLGLEGKEIQESSRATEDLQMANQYAEKILYEFGMDEELGPRTFGQKEEFGYQGSEITRFHRDFSEDKAALIDEKIKNILLSCLEDSNRILAENLDKIERLVNGHGEHKGLLEKEELEGEEIDKILQS